MTPETQQLNRWLRSQLFIARSEGRCTHLAIKHITPNSKGGNEVKLYEIPEDVDADIIEDIANDIYAVVNDDGNVLGGRQSYAVQAIYDKKIVARFPIRVDADLDPVEDMDSEPATSKGVLTQIMRHNEATNRIMVASLTQVFTALGRTINRLSERNEHLEDDKIKTLDMYAQLVDNQHQRKIETDREEIKNKAIEESIDTVKALAPVVAAKLLGKGGPDASRAQLEGFLNSLDANQLQTIADSLKPAQKAALAELISGDPAGEGGNTEH